MSDKRTATQILLNIEGDIKYLKSAYQALDHKLNLILNRLNAGPVQASSHVAIGASKPLAPNFIPSAGPKEPPNDLQFTQVGAETITATPVSRLEPEQDDDGNFELQVEQVPKGVRRNSNRPNPLIPPTESGERVQVQQKINYPDGAKVALATVNIFDAEGSLAKTTRTNSFGNWVAVLYPGTYRVNVKKPPLKDRVPVEVEYTVSIPMSDTPVELEPPKL